MSSRSVAMLAFMLALTAQAVARDLPDFGLMVNNDGDLSFESLDPQESAAKLRARVEALPGMGVKTVMYSVGAGSDILYYPTTVASVWGWRTTPQTEGKTWADRIARNKAGMAAGVDPIRVVGQRTKELGLFFVPSYRMNDSHFAVEPLENPLTGEFWMKHHERLKLGASPVPGHPHYANLLDFSHAEVREYRLGVLFEMIERYQDIMDGVEMDFVRVQILFPPGKAAAGAPLITEMVEKARKRLDEVGAKNGRPYALFVRVPPTLRNCRWAGLDVEAWLKQRLVDVLIPSLLMTLAHDMPVDEFVALAQPAGCRVCPALLPRTSFQWPFSQTHDAAAYKGAAKREVTPELVLGAACNYRRMGASGFQLFNFGLPPYEFIRPILASLSHPSSLAAATKVFAITPAYWLDHEDSYEYRKQVPLDLATDKPKPPAGSEPARGWQKGASHAFKPHTITLFVGEDLGGPGAPAPSFCALRLGFVGATPETELALTVNGHVLHSGPLGEMLVSVRGTAPSNQRSYPPPATAYVQIPLTDLRVLRLGVNTLELTARRPPSQAPLRLVEAQLGV
ncbi:MAG: hypothetical protein FJ279_13075, partial [Planctomycetes bacterium]|nr:hypothetical protein [Planctomycetota bacterium]